MAGAECATTHPARCAYHQHRPQSEEGSLVWAAFEQHGWRLKVGGMGTVIGVEEEPILRALRREGLPDELAELLVAPCVAGMIAAVNEKDDTDGKD